MLVASASYMTPMLRESRCAETERKQLSAAQVAQLPQQSSTVWSLGVAPYGLPRHARIRSHLAA